MGAADSAKELNGYLQIRQYFTRSNGKHRSKNSLKKVADAHQFMYF
jgi:hypothetical protein